MSSLDAFNSTVAARTRTATHILADRSLLELYLAEGGLEKDLTSIESLGLRAATLKQHQSHAQAADGAATADVLATFATLQEEYSAVMAVVQAVRRDLIDADASKELIAAIAKILVNESQVVIRAVEPKAPKDAAAEAASVPAKRRAVKSQSQEALRAEIEKDASALLDLVASHKSLQARRVDKKRLTKLRDAAKELSGKLANRAVTKGARKRATKEEHDAVAAQKVIWGACYRLLSAVGRKHHGISELLKDAARKR